MTEETEIRRNPIKDEARFILEESRIVVPGIQALFGFQLIAVFNQGFSDKLSALEQFAHVGAIFTVVVAMVLCMGPAAFHRLAEPGSVSNRFLRIASSMLAWAMAFLRVGVCIDFYLVARIVTDSSLVAGIGSAVLFAFCYAVWSLFPRYVRRMSPQFRSEAPGTGM